MITFFLMIFWPLCSIIGSTSDGPHFETKVFWDSLEWSYDFWSIMLHNLILPAVNWLRVWEKSTNRIPRILERWKQRKGVSVSTASRVNCFKLVSLCYVCVCGGGGRNTLHVQFPCSSLKLSCKKATIFNDLFCPGDEFEMNQQINTPPLRSVHIFGRLQGILITLNFSTIESGGGQSRKGRETGK